MKKLNYFRTYFPLCFFIFLAFFILVKFIFIYFFNAAFEPSFIFDLTPYYVLAGVNQLHLILLSLIIIVIDAYLHFRFGKRHLLFSFIPTAIMIIGLGVRIATSELELSYIPHLVIFGLLLLILLIDHKHFLLLPAESSILDKAPIEKIFKHTREAPAPVSIPVSPTQVVERPMGTITVEDILQLYKETLGQLQTIIRDDVQATHSRITELEQKMSKVDFLEEEIKKIQPSNSIQGTFFTCPFFQAKGLTFHAENSSSIVAQMHQATNTFDASQNLDDISECAALIKRGIIKEINIHFTELLGVEKSDVLEKSFIDFIAPDGLLKVKEYYIKRLEGYDVSSYETIILTHDQKMIPVTITMNNVIYDGNNAYLALIQPIVSQPNISVSTSNSSI